MKPGALWMEAGVPEAEARALSLEAGVQEVKPGAPRLKARVLEVDQVVFNSVLLCSTK